MNYTLVFLLNSILLGIGLAMDAFSVSMANGMHDAGMSAKRRTLIAGCFAFFQFLMPMIGWICVHTLVSAFRGFMRFVPWIALFLLCYIGGKMLLEGIREGKQTSGNEAAVRDGKAAPASHSVPAKLTAPELFIQGIATSIDALSVGFTIADYGAASAFVCALIIAAVTFVICIAGVQIGKKAGDLLAGKASILGGIILIAIGIEIFIQ